MNNSVDVSKTIAPKSDQLNADDLVGGPRTITITSVWGNQGAADQPISIGFEGDDRRPYKPCKSMRRVLVAIWGSEGQNYVGKSLRLYCDPEVKFGGIAVGGIRISHASHITQAIPVLLTTTRSKRANFVVRPIEDAPQDQRPKEQDESSSAVLDPDALESLISAAKSQASDGVEAYRLWFAGDKDQPQDYPGLSKDSRLALTSTMRSDPDDFDNEKSVHDICKGIAARADDRD